MSEIGWAQQASLLCEHLPCIGVCSCRLTDSAVLSCFDIDSAAAACHADGLSFASSYVTAVLVQFAGIRANCSAFSSAHLHADSGQA